MIYFIPSWQSLSNGPTDFDDIVHQLRMFQENGVEIELVLPIYLPNIRYQLNNQGLTNIKYWSVFDQLQAIKSVKALPTKLEDLDFPKDVEFIYTPTCIIVMLAQAVFAKIYYSEFGFVSTVDYFKDNILIKKEIFDDRGFLSSSVIFGSDGVQVRIDYFDENHNLTMQQYMMHDHISWHHEDVIETYQNISDLIIENLKNHFVQTKGLHTMIISASLGNSYLTQLSNLTYRTIVSFFDNRFDLKNEPTLKVYLDDANAVVVDTPLLKQQIEQFCQLKGIKQLDNSIRVLPPFDARLKLGESSSFKLQKIYWYIDSMLTGQSHELAEILTDELLNNKRRSLLIASTDPNKINSIMNQIVEAIRLFYQVDENSFIYQAVLKKITDESENRLAKSEMGELEDTDEWENATDAILAMQRVEAKTIYSEHSITLDLKNTRLVLYLNQKLNMFLQISALSAGIPQINLKQSVYVVNKKNGLVIENIAHIKEALHYYLDVLMNWNESLVYNVSQIEKYSGKKTVQKWIELVKGEYEKN
ncbi:accessory Sec system protein Asp1 [Leuconostoc gelidum subsp. gasicomitatum]|uniref:accessory Sec system protein Asp1 n=1 Tax=Leuconostoc gasicomitatum TaxID=115778 RepID=UPI001CC76EEA|nr:accessory Sec system protein Asp1 [Leuconostoc gasicomitatum]MBZ5965540.1 accessory Sec system protein Asp1 [Leuconostoc gasicomitatum]